MEGPHCGHSPLPSCGLPLSIGTHSAPMPLVSGWSAVLRLFSLNHSHLAELLLRPHTLLVPSTHGTPVLSHSPNWSSRCASFTITPSCLHTGLSGTLNIRLN